MLHKLQGQCPRDSAQGQATLRKADPQKEEEESCHEQSAGGEAEAGEYSAAHQLYGEGRRGGSCGKKKTDRQVHRRRGRRKNQDYLQEEDEVEVWEAHRR